MAALKHNLSKIIKNFQLKGEFLEVRPYGSGHINETYVSRFNSSGGVARYIHQRINHTIFKNVPELMENIERVTKHIRKKVEERGGDINRETLNLIPAADNKAFYLDDEGEYWRTYIFIEGARTYDLVENLNHIYNASKAFGNFQKELTDLGGERLFETIPDFHHTKKRYERFLEAVRNDVKNRAKSARDEIEFVKNRADDTKRIVDLIGKGGVPERITHNDTKFNNVMIDDKTGEGICIIDLDTVMPGSALYDFGDSVRIGASTALEDEQDLSKVSMSLDMFERLAHGYLDAGRDFLLPKEIELLAFSCKLLTFECGMRFLTDYLKGDVYFRVHRENHNLYRCRTQFKMVSDMEEKTDKMQEIIQKYR
jgi:hypothetical protein